MEMPQKIRIHHRLKHLTEPDHGIRPGGTVSSAHAVPLGIRQRAFQFRAITCQMQMAFPLTVPC